MGDESSVAEAPTTTPETASEITETPATAPETTTTPSVEVPSDSAGKAAGGVEGYLKAKAEAMKPKPKAEPPAQAAPASTEEIPPAAPATTETPPVSTETPPATVPATAPAAIEPEPEEKGPERIRIKGLKDGHLVVAATNIAREEGIPFAEAFARVSKPAETPSPATPAASTLRSREDVQKDIATAKEERRSAAEASDKLEQGSAKRMVDAEERLEALHDEMGAIEQHEFESKQEAETAARSAFTKAVTDSKSKVVSYWPESGVANSDFSKRMIELSDQYEADPLLAHHCYEADAPFFFGELVAKERGELPAHLKKAAPAQPATTSTQPSTPSATKPAPVNQRAVGRTAQPAAAPASGAARTTQGAPKDDSGVDGIRSVADYERVKKKLLVGAR